MTTDDATHIDDEARARIRQDLNQTLFVEASAGTGKTSALVDRYVSLVLAGRPVERLVAITFTEKAAAELRDRVRRELEERRPGVDAGGAGLIDKALGSLDGAPVSTIHAFCRTLLSVLAVNAGVDPTFGMLDEVSAERRFEEHWRTYLENLGSDDTARRVMSRVLDLGMWASDLEKLAHDLYAHPDLVARLQDKPLVAPQASWPDIEEMRRSILECKPQSIVQGDLLRDALEKLMAFLDELDAAGGEQEALLATRAGGLSPRLANTGRAGAWGGSGAIDAARNCGRDVVETLQSSLAALRAQALADVMPYIVKFVAQQAWERGREGTLVFDDLILRVRDVLASDTTARFRVRARYDCILIDEFQDTDPLQAEIALYFAGVPDFAPRPGSLFLVGDPKQSIYRFRRADMAIYSRIQEQLKEAGAEPVYLSLNRRSRPGVVSWVNRVFATLIGDGSLPEMQPPYRDLVPDRDDTIRGPAVAVFGGARALPAREVRYLEAGLVAAYCRQVRDQGWEVSERDGKTLRPATYRDIAILVPARTILPALERSLANAGVPYRVEGGSLIYGTQELRDLINCLTAIDDPTDEVAVVAALRSPAYACSDVDLARHKLSGFGFNYTSPQIYEWQGPAAEALYDLANWHSRRQNMRLVPLIEEFVARRRLVEIGLLDGGNRDAFRRARFLVEQARTFEADEPQSLRAFVEWLEQRASGAIMDRDAAALDDDEDAVRVLTIHAAKGLEFPIVFLAGLGSTFINRTGIFGHDRDTGEIAVSIGARSRNSLFELGPTGSTNAHELDHLRYERSRLLYVAATRARDHLVVSLLHPDRTPAADAAVLIKAGAADGVEQMPPVGMPQDSNIDRLGTLQITPSDLDERLLERGRLGLIAASRTRTFESATGIGRRQGEADAKWERRDVETEPWLRGRAATKRGRAVHAALQVVPWDADIETIQAVARAQAVAEAIPGQIEPVSVLIQRALESKAGERARAAKRALREVPFSFTYDKAVVEGFIDLVLEGEDGSLEIIDWKTDAITNLELPDRVQEYTLQIGLYIKGLQAATGREVSKATLVFIAAPQTMEASHDELGPVVDAAVEELDYILGRK